MAVLDHGSRQIQQVISNNLAVRNEGVFPRRGSLIRVAPNRFLKHAALFLVGPASRPN